MTEQQKTVFYKNNRAPEMSAWITKEKADALKQTAAFSKLIEQGLVEFIEDK